MVVGAQGVVWQPQRGADRVYGRQPDAPAAAVSCLMDAAGVSGFLHAAQQLGQLAALGPLQCSFMPVMVLPCLPQLWYCRCLVALAFPA